MSLKTFFKYDWFLFGKFNGKWTVGPFQFTTRILDGEYNTLQLLEFASGERKWPDLKTVDVRVCKHDDKLIDDFNI